MKAENLLKINSFLNDEQVERLIEMIGQLEFQDGRSTATERAIGVKNNLQLSQLSGYAKQAIEGVLIQAITSNQQIQETIFPLKVFPPIISKYTVGMYYGSHVDSPVMADAQVGLIRTDMAMTLFLAHANDYEGGELVLLTDEGEVAIKLNRGSAVFYPASILHRVNEVKKGERLAMISWIQSLIPDPGRRAIVAEIKKIERKISLGNPYSDEALGLLQVYSNLIKMWSII